MAASGALLRKRPATQPGFNGGKGVRPRRNLSSTAPSPIQLVEVTFPAGQRVTYETGARETEVHQQVWIIEGTTEMTIGDKSWRLEIGDCLTMRLEVPITFRNPTRKPARYLVALANMSNNNPRGNG